MTTDDFLQKYDEKTTKFTESELKTLYWGEFEDYKNVKFINREYGEDGRWSRPVCAYYLIKDRYFCFYCDKGLTEYQEDEFNSQPREVVPQERIIQITEWVGV